MTDQDQRCPDCGARTPNLEQHRRGCSRFQAAVAARAESRRPRELSEMGRDAQIVTLAEFLRRKGARNAPRPSDDQAIAFALRHDLDDPDVLVLAHALCQSAVTTADLREGARLATFGGQAQADLFALLGILSPGAVPDELLSGR